MYFLHGEEEGPESGVNSIGHKIQNQADSKAMLQIIYTTSFQIMLKLKLLKLQTIVL